MAFYFPMCTFCFEVGPKELLQDMVFHFYRSVLSCFTGRSVKKSNLKTTKKVNITLCFGPLALHACLFSVMM